jgi:hypothetical protein
MISGIAGLYFTVTVIVNGAPVQEPVMETGVTIYSTEPDTVLLGSVNTWSIKDPEPAEAPVTPPVMFPMVQVKVLGVLDVRVILGLVLLQILAVEGVVTLGSGLTVTVIV